MCYNNDINVSSISRSGGLSLGWKGHCTFSLRSFSKNYIDIMIDADSHGNSWRFTGFYGALEVGNKRDSWNLLRSLHNTSIVPWCVAGEFIEILLSSEKQGGLVRNSTQMQNFRDALLDCHLEDWKIGIG
ncbi:hypothetical protein GQ457_16G011290 [Hibiscus cannabinus]